MLNISEESLFNNTARAASNPISIVGDHAAWVEKQSKRGAKQVFAERVHLTPELAMELLSRNESNRTVKHIILDSLITDIRAGNWRLNGQTIIVSSDGKLNDGQHRCMAVVHTGIAVDTIISFGVTRDSRTTVDTGGKKTVGDFLSMDGAPNGNQVATVAKMIWQYANFGQIYTLRRDKAPTAVETQATYWEHAAEIEAAMKGTSYSGSQKIGHFTLVVFAAVLLRRRNPELANEYIAALCKGAGLAETSPIYQARERLGDPASRRLKGSERLEIVLRHWNAWRRGQRMKKPSPLQSCLPEIEA